MKRVFFLIITLCICVAIDMGSKHFIVNDFSFEYCSYWESQVTESPITFFTAITDLWAYDIWFMCDTPMMRQKYGEILNHGIPLLGDFISIKLSYNSWVAFSLPIQWILLQCITLILIIGLLYQYITVEYTKNNRWIDAAYVLILAWALSHAYERIFFGHVIDFIAVKYFAILNIADIFISVGAFFLILAYVRSRKSE